MKPVTIYDVACPFCKALAGDRCIAYPSGTHRSVPHLKRRRAFVRTQERTS